MCQKATHIFRIIRTILIKSMFSSQELGMFMSCLTVVGNNGNPIYKICKSRILEFK